MRRIAALVLAGSLVASASAYAGDGALQPGKPAGVRQAQIDGSTSTLVFLGVMAGVIAAVAIGTSDENKNVPVVVTTSTTA